MRDSKLNLISSTHISRIEYIKDRLWARKVEQTIDIAKAYPAACSSRWMTVLTCNRDNARVNRWQDLAWKRKSVQWDSSTNVEIDHIHSYTSGLIILSALRGPFGLIGLQSISLENWETHWIGINACIHGNSATGIFDINGELGNARGRRAFVLIRLFCHGFNFSRQ